MRIICFDRGQIWPGPKYMLWTWLTELNLRLVMGLGICLINLYQHMFLHVLQLQWFVATYLYIPDLGRKSCIHEWSSTIIDHIWWYHYAHNSGIIAKNRYKFNVSWEALSTLGMSGAQKILWYSMMTMMMMMMSLSFGHISSGVWLHDVSQTDWCTAKI